MFTLFQDDQWATSKQAQLNHVLIIFIYLTVYIKIDSVQPFHRVLSSASSKGRSVAGVLEANFIKPTHDKQDFEKSQLFQKLMFRLKEMTTEYW